MVFVKGVVWAKTFWSIMEFHALKNKLDLVYFFCKSDYEILFRTVTAQNVFEYQQYVLIFVYDIIHTYHNMGPTMKTLDNIYGLKPDSIDKPKRYPGANVGTYQI